MQSSFSLQHVRKYCAYMTLTATPTAAVMSMMSPFISQFIWIVLCTASYKRNPISTYTNITLIIADKTSRRKMKTHVSSAQLLHCIPTKHCSVFLLTTLCHFCHKTFFLSISQLEPLTNSSPSSIYISHYVYLQAIHKVKLI